MLRPIIKLKPGREWGMKKGYRKVRTSELEGVALDWAAGQAVNRKISTTSDALAGVKVRICWCDVTGRIWNPSTNWSQGGPLIENECVSLLIRADGMWLANAWPEDIQQQSPQPLIAACRAIVAAKLGDEVEIPQELMPCTAP